MFFDLSFTRKAENLVCKNVEIIGNVIFVILSRHSIFGITVNASRSNDNKCDTAREITELVCIVSASVNNSNSPEDFLYPSIHAQFFPIHPSGFGLASTKITLPMISTFLHTRFSALRVNDKVKNTGYFFGSFFIMKKTTYDSVGTHEGVKSEIVEDGALGKKVKESNFKMRMVRGEHLIDAVWARDSFTLWNALKRLMIPLYLQNARIAVASFFGVLFLLFMPFPIFAYSAIIFNSDSSLILFVISCIASLLVYLGGIIDAVKGLELKLRYSLLAPVGSLIVVSGFLAGLIQAKSKTAVSWRGRTYQMKGQVQKSINV